MVVGLLNIARQAIQRGLTEGGITLGLLGVEKSLQTVVFVFKPEFRAACQYAFSGSYPAQINIRHIIGVIFVVCSLSTVVGPSSYVMMVPKISWSQDKPLELNGTAYTYGSRCYPYIMINPALDNLEGKHKDHRYNAIFDEQPSTDNFWQGFQNSNDQRTSPYVLSRNQRYGNMVHHYRNWDYAVTVNTSWPMEERDISGSWVGETNFETSFLLDSAAIDYIFKTEYQQPKKYGRSLPRVITDTTQLLLQTVCRQRKRRARYPETNLTDFSFRSVGSNPTYGPEINSSRLLLLNEMNGQKSPGSDVYTVNITKIWITEGFMETNSKFTDTILIVLEHDASNDSLIVCSNEATIKNMEAISTSDSFDASEFRNSSKSHDYFLSKNSSSSPRKLLYHKEWLDYIHNLDYQYMYENYNYANYSAQVVPAPRNISKIPANRYLQVWAEGFSQLSWYNDTSLDPKQLELAIGGSFLSVLSRIMPSDTQYTSLLNVNMSENRGAPDAGFVGYSFRSVHYPANLMIENITGCVYGNTVIRVSYNVYGYQWKRISKILSMVVLLLHVLVAILGSVWQLKQRGVIKA